MKTFGKIVAIIITALIVLVIGQIAGDLIYPPPPGRRYIFTPGGEIGGAVSLFLLGSAIGSLSFFTKKDLFISWFAVQFIVAIVVIVFSGELTYWFWKTTPYITPPLGLGFGIGLFIRRRENSGQQRH